MKKSAPTRQMEGSGLKTAQDRILNCWHRPHLSPLHLSWPTKATRPTLGRRTPAVAAVKCGLAPHFQRDQANNKIEPRRNDSATILTTHTLLSIARAKHPKLAARLCCRQEQCDSSSEQFRNRRCRPFSKIQSIRSANLPPLQPFHPAAV